MTTACLDAIDHRLLEDWQRDLPLVARPYEVLAEELGIEETGVLSRLTRLRAMGAISRVGGVVRPNTVSASTLAAISAPALQIDDIAEIVGQEPGVNHSYLRENVWNLWFVVTGPDRPHVAQALHRIERRTGLPVLELHLERAYHIDLGFPLDGRDNKPPGHTMTEVATTFRFKKEDPNLIQALTHGLPLESRPFDAIGARLGRSETSVLQRLTELCDARVMTRIGVIVRHRALGWRSNAMVVWDISPEVIDEVGLALAQAPGVNLCYRRTRNKIHWPYNLYCMVHAKTREEALATIEQATIASGLKGYSRQILFSIRCFKQQGALLTSPGEVA